MADVAIFQEERVETFSRVESRFEQKCTSIMYCSESLFLFPSTREETGNVTYNVSDVAKRMGILTPVFVSSGLYREEILNRTQNPIKNIETLFHAFLYAVDCDMKDKCALEFPVPGNGSAPYKARAYLRGFRDKNILLERVIE
ncbi:MAG TPA: hypothetical protein PLU93_08045 [Treponemataceae bacterium]|nr:hypothetical protein [Treponemataceae bacterium]